MYHETIGIVSNKIYAHPMYRSDKKIPDIIQRLLLYILDEFKKIKQVFFIKKRVFFAPKYFLPIIVYV